MRVVNRAKALQTKEVLHREKYYKRGREYYKQAEGIIVSVMNANILTNKGEKKFILQAGSQKLTRKTLKV